MMNTIREKKLINKLQKLEKQLNEEIDVMNKSHGRIIDTIYAVFASVAKALDYEKD